MGTFESFTVTFGRFEYSVIEGTELSPFDMAYQAEQNSAFSELWNDGHPEEGLNVYPVGRFNTSTEQYETHDTVFLWWIAGSDCGQINNAGLWHVGPAQTLEEALRCAFAGVE